MSRSKKKKIPAVVKNIINAKPQEINFAFQKSISFSQISMYNQCPYKWKLNYVDGLGTYEHSINSVFGTAMHEAVQKFIEIMYTESKAAAVKFEVVKYFKSRLMENYQKAYIDNNKVHFSDPKELEEFYEDGINILHDFVKKIGKYFSIRGWYLVGIELPIRMAINHKYPNIIYNGYIDLVLYHEPTDSFELYDFKTSTYSWRDKQKKDSNKHSQLVMYKHLFSQLYGIDINKISVKFFILKRKLYENSEFAQSRLQEFSPPSGKVKINKALENVNNFIFKCFNPEGGFKEQDLKPKENYNTCRWCSFKDKDGKCNPQLTKKNKKPHNSINNNDPNSLIYYDDD